MKPFGSSSNEESTSSDAFAIRTLHQHADAVPSLAADNIPETSRGCCCASHHFILPSLQNGTVEVLNRTSHHAEWRETMPNPTSLRRVP